MTADFIQKACDIINATLTSKTPAFLKELLTQGHKRSIVNAKDDKTGDTVLHIASRCGKIEIIDLLLVENRDIHEPAWLNQLNNAKNAAIHVATSRSDNEIVEKLVKAGADVNLLGSWGDNPGVLVKKLAPRYTPASFQGVQFTPVHVAVLFRYLSTVQLLVNILKARIDIGDSNKRLPIHLAALLGHLDIVKLFVTQHRQAVNVRGQDNLTPLDFSEINGHQEVSRFLRENGGMTAYEIKHLSQSSPSAFGSPTEIHSLPATNESKGRSLPVV